MIYLVFIAELIQIVLLFCILNKKEESKKEEKKREHAKMPTAKFASPLNPYDIYKNKKTQLYEPRTPGRGIKIEVEETDNGR